MQVLKLYSIRDTKTEIFNPPFVQKTHGEAERTFGTLSNDPNTNISKFPEDFELYYLGEFNDHSGKTQMLDTPQHIIKAVHLVKNNSASLAAVQ